jgi:hypothetical protein
MGKFIGTDFDRRVKSGHGFLKIQLLMKLDQQQVFDLEESVWTEREKKNRLRFRIYRTKISAIEPFVAASAFHAIFEHRKVKPR